MNRLVLENYVRLKNGTLKDGKVKYGLIVIKVFQPLDMRVKEFLDTHVKQIKKLVFVEMNYSGQLQELISNKCLLHDKKWNNKIGNIRKVTSYPIFAEEIVI
jgi:pyruvate/2-oxoacid:ferredoxin oxidoreductase alpha subunit